MAHAVPFILCTCHGILCAFSCYIVILSSLCRGCDLDAGGWLRVGEILGGCPFVEEVVDFRWARRALLGAPGLDLRLQDIGDLAAAFLGPLLLRSAAFLKILRLGYESLTLIFFCEIRDDAEEYEIFLWLAID